MSDRGPTDTTMAEARIEGWLEGVRGDAITGWALDRTSPGTRVEVAIWLDERRLGITRADRHRPDLARLGIGDGRHGFRFVPEPPLENADLRRVYATVSHGPSPPVRLGKLDGGRGTGDVAGVMRRMQEVLRSMAADQARAVEACTVAFRDVAQRVDDLEDRARRGEPGEERPHGAAEELERRLAMLEATTARLDELVLEVLARNREAAVRTEASHAWHTVLVLVLASAAGGLIGYFAGVA